MTTVYKIGGSLLDLPDLPSRLRRVLVQRPNSRPLLIAGGGAAADVVRKWDAVHHLDADAAHWLAIRAMGLNERLLEILLPKSIVVSNREQAAAAWADDKTPILCAVDFLQSEQRFTEQSRARQEAQNDMENPLRHGRGSSSELPHTWDATSDSIAASIAQCWPADELVLIKSCDPPAADQIADEKQTAVDAHFHVAAAGLDRIGWVNLRGDSPTIREY